LEACTFTGESMRCVILLASCLALAGCADIAARQQLLSERGPQYLTRLHDLTLQPYREWVRTEPTDCESPKLLEARASVLDTAMLIRPKTQGFEASYDSVAWMLEVADGASAHGCHAVARTLYDKVKAVYVGFGYTPLRQHALNGIAQTEQ